MTQPSAELHAESRGAGPHLLVLHPAGLDHGFMAGVVDAAARSHRVTAVDLRGHGRSPDAADGTTLDDHVEDLRTTIERHCDGRASVLGLSMGGMLAQLLAVRHPQRVSRLVLCGCAGGFAEEARPLLRERGAAAQRGGMAAVVEATVERWFTPAFRVRPVVDEVRRRLLQNDPQNWCRTWHAIAGLDVLPRLAGIDAPTLVVAGGRDAATPAAATRAIADAIPGARHVELADAPHMMQLECPDAFNAAVLAFLCPA